MRPTDAWTIRRLLGGLDVNGHLPALSGPLQGIGTHLDGLPLVDRPRAWEGYLCGRPDRNAVIMAIANADPYTPPPSAPAFRSAHLGDLVASAGANRFVWQDRIVRGHFNLLSSDPKIGKTHLMLDIAGRVYFARDWPDGQAPTFPQGATTLWVCGDRHQDELRERANAFGLPDEGVRLNADESNAYGGWDLDLPDNVDLLRRIVEAERPALVIIDTVWRATRRQLRREEELNALLDPIISIAQDTDTAVVGLMHLSKDGETLGRRIEGLARSIMKLTRPDPEGHSDRRRLQVTGNFKELPVMGLTIKDDGCDWDFNPPSAPAVSRPGRTPVKIDKAVEFLTSKLSQGDAKQCDLINEWLGLGESKDPFFRAVEAMEADERLVVDDSKKPKICHLIPKQP
jgi:hypothetical protein